MRLSQIIAEADDHVNYDGLDPRVIARLSKYKSHQQQWAVKELREGGDINSVVDALDYYIAKIGDNRFQNILKPKTPTPKNILSLSLDDIKAAQHDFELQYNRLSRRECERLRSNVLLDTPDLKIVEFKKSSTGDIDTAKALAAAAQFTKWCVVNTETGDGYLNKGPIYLITMGEAEYKVVVPNGQPVATNRYLCHLASRQLMDVQDQEKQLSEQVCLVLREYITGIGIFCNDDKSDVAHEGWRSIVGEADDVKHDLITEPTFDSLSRAFEYAYYIIKGRWPEAEPYIMQDPYVAYEYAHFVIDGRWPEAEPTIMKDLQSTHNYAIEVIRGRWPEAEPIIMKSPGCAYEYALKVIKGRWPQAEPTIMKDPTWAYAYTDKVIKGRWPEAEPYIMQDPFWACYYALRVIKGRWPEAEPTIARRADTAYDYAVHIIKSRWPEAEPRIRQNQEILEKYITYCIFYTPEIGIEHLNFVGQLLQWPEAEQYIKQNQEILEKYMAWVRKVQCMQHRSFSGKIFKLYNSLVEKLRRFCVDFEYHNSFN